ncbi:hypothetical protein T10_13478, partial [Trichinella papuae]
MKRIGDSDKESHESGTGDVPKMERRAEQSGPTPTITLPKKLELESQVYSPIRGNLDTGRDPQTVGGATDDRRIALRANPKGLVPGNGT